MSAKRRAVPTLGLHETFDRVHDGEMVVDANACVVALFITRDGTVGFQAKVTDAEAARMLRQIADQVEARAS